MGGSAGAATSQREFFRVSAVLPVAPGELGYFYLSTHDKPLVRAEMLSALDPENSKVLFYRRPPSPPPPLVAPRETIEFLSVSRRAISPRRESREYP